MFRIARALIGRIESIKKQKRAKCIIELYKYAGNFNTRSAKRSAIRVRFLFVNWLQKDNMRSGPMVGSLLCSPMSALSKVYHRNENRAWSQVNKKITILQHFQLSRHIVFLLLLFPFSEIIFKRLTGWKKSRPKTPAWTGFLSSSVGRESAIQIRQNGHT